MREGRPVRLGPPRDEVRCADARTRSGARQVTGLLLACLVGLALMTAVAVVEPAPAAAHIVPRGIVDETLLSSDPLTQEAILTELSDQLHCSYTRVTVDWHLAEPVRGQYADDYLSTIRTTIASAVAHGLRVIVLVYYTPEWASDTRFWNDPPKHYKAGVYHWFYPVRPSALDDWQAFAGHLAGLLSGLVYGYECWCEPNLWGYLWPQKTSSDPDFSVHYYSRLLRYFYRGVKAADRRALVIGGVTASFGANNRYGTSPQRFATRLKKTGAARYMNAYAHHPYPYGLGAPAPAPTLPPLLPKLSVTLGNIRTLLRIYPHMSFYLDEFGYGTAPSDTFPGGQVSKTKQARYLKQAYTLVDRHPQIKALLWFLRQDYSPGGTKYSPKGLYMGLRDLKGDRKPAWYAFARLPRP
jgi:hypothetical protein